MGALIIGYVVMHPVLQLWALLSCRRGWRVAAVAGLLVLGPFYLWALYKVFGPQTGAGDLSGLLILPLAPFSLIYLGIVGAAGARERADKGS
jgi:hypothetical protein